jgi:hypothetical protein
VGSKREATRAAGHIELSERAFQAFAAQAQQTLAARVANALPISIHGIARHTHRGLR